MAAASEAIGRHLNVSRVGYGEIDSEEKTVSVERDWTDGFVSSLAGETRPLDVFGPAIIDVLRSGRTLRLDDIAADPEAAPYAEGYESIGTRSLLIVPLIKEGRFTAILYLHEPEPRRWTDEDVTLAEEVAERTWSAVEAARAKAALEASEEKLRALNAELEARVEERTRELQEAVRESEGFNYAIAHDLRAPLRAIVSTSSILVEEAGPKLSEDHRFLLVRQAANATRLGTLIDELLRLSRLARAKVRCLPLDMTAKAQGVAEVEAAEWSGAVEVQEGMTAEGDPDLVRILLHNLIGNACKFSSSGGTVRVGQRGKVFYVSDQGVGFDMRYAERIFQPFERLVPESEFPGTGIGLANVERIVRRHGGRVWAEAEVGKGATFFFTLGPLNGEP
jgi:signal transduction histidine kinase